MTSRRAPAGRPQRKGRHRYYARRKVCSFCVDHVRYIDYKKVEAIKRYVDDQSKIQARRKTGTCARHQRGLAHAIKRARHLAMIPISRSHHIPSVGFSG